MCSTDLGSCLWHLRRKAGASPTQDLEHQLTLWYMMISQQTAHCQSNQGIWFFFFFSFLTQTFSCLNPSQRRHLGWSWEGALPSGTAWVMFINTHMLHWADCTSFRTQSSLPGTQGTQGQIFSYYLTIWCCCLRAAGLKSTHWTHFGVSSCVCGLRLT